MSIPPFSQVVIGFGNSKGETITRLLAQQIQKINRVNVKSHFGANPKVSIKPISEISLVPFSQMIYKKRDQQMLKQILNSHKENQHKTDISKIKLSAQKQLQQLTCELELLRNFKQNQDVEKVINKTSCTEKEAKKYLQTCGSSDKAIQKINEHKKLIEQVSKNFQCSKQDAKSFLEANNYSTSVLG